jgi:hypothetical protein
MRGLLRDAVMVQPEPESPPTSSTVGLKCGDDSIDGDWISEEEAMDWDV